MKRWVLPIPALLSMVGCTIEYELKPTETEEPTLPGEDVDCTAECFEEEDTLPEGCSVVECGYQVAIGVDPEHAVTEFADTYTGGTCQMVFACDDDDCMDDYRACIDEGNSDDFCDELLQTCVRVNDCADQLAADLEWLDAWLEDWLEECDGDACEFWECYHRLRIECEYENCINGTEYACGEIGVEGGGYEECLPPPPLPIVQTGPSRWAVDRDLVLAQLDELDRLGRLNPSWAVRGPSGGLGGVQLGAIELGGPIHRLGFERLDIITAVNGVPVADLLLAPANLISLASADALTVRLRRAGSSRQHRYDLE